MWYDLKTFDLLKFCEMDDILNGKIKREKYQKLGVGIESGDPKLILDCVLTISNDLCNGIFQNLLNF